MCIMDVVSCKIFKCMGKCKWPKCDPRLGPQCFLLYFCNITTVLQRSHSQFCIGSIIECRSQTCITYYAYYNFMKPSL